MILSYGKSLERRRSRMDDKDYKIMWGMMKMSLYNLINRNPSDIEKIVIDCIFEIMENIEKAEKTFMESRADK
jgi:hypothetical protein